MPNEILARITSHTNEKPVLSIFLDMSVNSDNKRTYQTFINQQRARFAEADNARESFDREHLTEAIARAETWLANDFEKGCKSAAIFTEIGGEWFHALSFPLPLQNRMEIAAAPITAPIRASLAGERRSCIVVVDREHLHLITTYVGKVEEDRTIRAETDHPQKHDVQAGGYAQKDLQKWKAEETRKSFRLFAEEIERGRQTRRIGNYVLLGTDENVKHFTEFLSSNVQDRIVHTGHAPSGSSTAEITRAVSPALADVSARETALAIDELLSRVRGEHLVTSGWQDTLRELQEGKVDQLFIASNESCEGAQCTQCGFYLEHRDGGCPYCGGTLRDGIDLVESAVRIADGQDVRLQFVAGDVVNGINGVSALLKFR